MENENREFKTSPNKDLWLFLIVLDVIFLCVFGFFLYKHFSAQVMGTPQNTAVATEVIETFPPAEELEVVTVDEIPSVAAQPSEPPTVVVPVLQTGSDETPKPAPTKPAVEKAPQVTQTAQAEVQPAPAEQVANTAKKSVVVTPVNGSKYRRVTFRWFEPAQTVAIVSGFTNRKAQPLKKVGDYWETTLSIAPGTYKFLYVINGKNTRDPYSPAKDGRSVVVVE